MLTQIVRNLPLAIEAPLRFSKGMWGQNDPATVWLRVRWGIEE